MRKTRVVALLMTASLTAALGGCLKQAGGGGWSDYVSSEGRFSVSVPASWHAEAMTGGLAGVVFVGDTADPAALTLWVVFGEATGRSPSEQMDYLQAIVAFLLGGGLSVMQWQQTPASPASMGGVTGAGTTFSCRLSGVPTDGLAVSVVHSGRDYLLIGLCRDDLWDSARPDFEQVVSSLVFR